MCSSDLLDVVFHILLAGAGTGSGDGVGRLHQAGHDGPGLHVAVVGLDGVDDVLALPVLPGQLHADLHVGGAQSRNAPAKLQKIINSGRCCLCSLC